MRRVSIVGSSGSGKSTVGRVLADLLGVPHVELDAIYHQPDWQPLDDAEFHRHLDEVTATDGWVVDGNYRLVVRDGPVWERADTVVWIDLPRRVVMRQVVGRTIGRLVRREELWNGNRERPSNLVRWDPEASIIRWAWVTHGQVRDRYEHLLGQPQPFEIVRLRSRAEIDQWLAGR